MSQKFLKPPSKLLNHNFVLLFFGQFTSHLGTQVYDIAMMLWIKEITGMASLMGLLLMVSHLPDVIIGPFAGTWADRLPRKKIIILADLISGVAIFTIVIIMLLFPHHHTLILVAIFIVAVLIGVCLSFLSPSIIASVPTMVPIKKVTMANSIMSTSEEGSVFIGQAIGGILYSIFGAFFSFFINGISYFLSSLSKIFITIPETHLKQKRTEQASFKDDLKKGLRYTWGNKGLRHSVIIIALQNFFLAPLIILLPFFVDSFLKIGPEWFGFLLAIYSVGSIIGYLCAGSIKIPGKLKSIIIISSHILIFILVLLIGIIITLPLSIIGIFLMGFFAGFNDVHILTILQLTIPNNLRGRVFGILGSVSKLLVPIAMGLSGIILDIINRDVPLLLCIISGSALFLSIFILSNKAFRELLSTEFSGNEGQVNR